MGQQLTVAEQRKQASTQFRSDFTKMGSEIGAALPPHIPPERFMRVVLTAVQSDYSLLEADRKSLFEASMKVAQDGLLPDKREGALVIYAGKVQWLPMIGGILKKVRNSGELASISAQIVYEHDEFLYILGDEERIEHQPKMDGDRGKPRAAYAIAKTKDGGIYREVMSLVDIEKVRKVSKASGKGPWVDWWDEMARKTVLRRLSKRLPMSSDMDDLLRRDDALYDFDKRGAAASAQTDGMFRPVNNPLQDTIEHRSGDEAAAESAGEERDTETDARDGVDDFPGGEALRAAEKASA